MKRVSRSTQFSVQISGPSSPHLHSVRFVSQEGMSLIVRPSTALYTPVLIVWINPFASCHGHSSIPGVVLGSILSPEMDRLLQPGVPDDWNAYIGTQTHPLLLRVWNFLLRCVQVRIHLFPPSFIYPYVYVVRNAFALTRHAWSVRAKFSAGASDHSGACRLGCPEIRLLILAGGRAHNGASTDDYYGWQWVLVQLLWMPRYRMTNASRTQVPEDLTLTDSTSSIIDRSQRGREDFQAD